MKHIIIIDDSFNTFTHIDFNDCLLEEAFEEAIELSKLKDKSILCRLNGVNLRFEKTLNTQEILDYYITAIKFVKQNFNNSVECLRALEISAKIGEHKNSIII